MNRDRVNLEMKTSSSGVLCESGMHAFKPGKSEEMQTFNKTG